MNLTELDNKITENVLKIKHSTWPKLATQVLTIRNDNEKTQRTNI